MDMAVGLASSSGHDPRRNPLMPSATGKFGAAMAATASISCYLMLSLASPWLAVVKESYAQERGTLFGSITAVSPTSRTVLRRGSSE